MMTFETVNLNCRPGVETETRALRIEAQATPLPVLGVTRGVTPVGVALAFADDAADACGEDRFSLLLIDGEGEVTMQLGPFPEEDVVAVWRDISTTGGLARMLLREDGSIVPVSQQLGPVVLGKGRQRRRHAALSGRRPRFLVRRKPARLPARPCIHRGESEIISRG
ncbi:hypothetical protein ASF53_08655 [Methylobacterium sp. Leaf123]|uniref:DUF6101 family protein n=1 Tax=Methylobacterium sp. Leaf123 TaxID=1736264 RepID=UPI0006FD0CCA|nr:DUF6101 family protein [Methylobacterium sp. Leaf123]KQQ14686.1 hypothetical protein ASF53_08655 [Methylobacterium sp. Leaf123]